MPTLVYELTGSFNNIQVDTHLIFPNVLTCVAIVGVGGGTMVGVHATIGDKARMRGIGERMGRRCPGTPDIYVVGPVSGYNLMPLVDYANNGRVRFFESDGGIDVEARYDNGTLSFGKGPAGSGDFTQIPLQSFS